MYNANILHNKDSYGAALSLKSHNNNSDNIKSNDDNNKSNLIPIFIKIYKQLHCEIFSSSTNNNMYKIGYNDNLLFPGLWLNYLFLNIGNNGIFNSNQFTYGGSTPSADLAIYQVSPGKALVKGYECEIISPSFLDCPKPRTTKTLNNLEIKTILR